MIPVFTPLERRLLSEVESSLETRAKILFARQIKSINLVQRHGGSREICCYRMKWGQPYRDAELQFPNASPELKFARVKFDVLEFPGKTWTAEFTLVKGYFFSIDFDPAAEPIQRKDDVRTIDIKHLADPLKETAGVTPTPRMGAPIFSGWLEGWLTKYHIQNVDEPLERKDRDLLIDAIPATLPADYLDLTRQADGFLVESCSILGLAEVHEIHLEEASYYVLAALNGNGVLAVKAGSKDGTVYYLDYDERNVCTKVKGLREAVEAYIAKERTRGQ